MRRSDAGMLGRMDRKREIICFGEILWDFLPRGLFLGGAPFNVAYHLKRLGLDPVFVSAVGDDVLGDEALRRVRAMGVPPDWVARIGDLPTGYVQVDLDERGDASYTIAEPVAWDRIPVGGDLIARAADADAMVFGSLAQRGTANRDSLTRLIEACAGMVVMDVNLRPPHDPPDLVRELARHADCLKMNEDEVFQLVGLARSEASLEDAMTTLSAQSACERICVTRAADGAAYLRGSEIISARSPKVTVADTVGAGDAFTAALVEALVSGAADSGDNAWLARACAVGATVASMDGATPDYDPTRISAAQTPDAE